MAVCIQCDYDVASEDVCDCGCGSCADCGCATITGSLDGEVEE